jgi:hypothetical protein
LLPPIGEILSTVFDATKTSRRVRDCIPDHAGMEAPKVVTEAAFLPNPCIAILGLDFGLSLTRKPTEFLQVPHNETI